jgi:hypothetical protein
MHTNVRNDDPMHAYERVERRPDARCSAVGIKRLGDRSKTPPSTYADAAGSSDTGASLAAASASATSRSKASASASNVGRSSATSAKQPLTACDSPVQVKRDSPLMRQRVAAKPPPSKGTNSAAHTSSGGIALSEGTRSVARRDQRHQQWRHCTARGHQRWRHGTARGHQQWYNWTKRGHLR